MKSQYEISKKKAVKRNERLSCLDLQNYFEREFLEEDYSLKEERFEELHKRHDSWSIQSANVVFYFGYTLPERCTLEGDVCRMRLRTKGFKDWLTEACAKQVLHSKQEFREVHIEYAGLTFAFGRVLNKHPTVGELMTESKEERHLNLAYRVDHDPAYWAHSSPIEPACERGEHEP